MATNYFLNQYITTKLNVGGGINDTQTTGIILQSVSGIDITKPGIALLSYSDPLDTSVAEWVTYTSIDGSNELQGVARGTEGFSAKEHANLVDIAFPISESHINNLASALSIGGTATNAVTTTLDEDNMASNSATALATQQSIKAYVDTQVVAASGISSLYQNLLINGNMDVWQRLDNVSTFTSATRVANNDDTYLMDRWNLISDGNDIVDVTRSTDKPDGSRYSAKFDVQTAKRFGIVQIIPTEDAIKLDNQTVSLSFKAKTDTTEITAIRVAILTWGSTADSVTSDVVGTWGATPTWATNWTAENTPADITIDSTWTTYEVENIAIDTATVNNIAVVIWTPNEESINDTLYITQVQLNQGAAAASFVPRTFEEEYMRCLKFYEQSWTYGVAQANSEQSHVSNTNGYLIVRPRVAKRAAMSTSNVSIYDGSTANQVRNTNTGGTVGSLTIDGVGVASDRVISLYDLSAFTANTAYDYNWIVNTEL